MSGLTPPPVSLAELSATFVASEDGETFTWDGEEVSLGNTSTFAHDGWDYVQSAGRIFIGPEDPADHWITPQEGDIWMDPS